MLNIKKCPFCNSEAELFKDKYDYENASIVCKSDSRHSIDAFNENKIISIWNKGSHSKDTTEELALICSIISEKVEFNKAVLSSFDLIFKIANLFLEKYPLNTNWEELIYDDTIIEFTEMKIRELK